LALVRPGDGVAAGPTLGAHVAHRDELLMYPFPFYAVKPQVPLTAKAQEVDAATAAGIDVMIVTAPDGPPRRPSSTGSRRRPTPATSASKAASATCWSTAGPAPEGARGLRRGYRPRPGDAGTAAVRRPAAAVARPPLARPRHRAGDGRLPGRLVPPPHVPLGEPRPGRLRPGGMEAGPLPGARPQHDRVERLRRPLLPRPAPLRPALPAGGHAAVAAGLPGRGARRRVPGRGPAAGHGRRHGPVA